MTPIKTRPRFRCTYCRLTGTKPKIARHEPRCFSNPNRFCDACGNTGELEPYRCGTCHGTGTHPYGYPCGCDGGYEYADCPHCKKFKVWQKNCETIASMSEYLGADSRW